jgi:hypothetical protein
MVPVSAGGMVPVSNVTGAALSGVDASLVPNLPGLGVGDVTQQQGQQQGAAGELATLPQPWADGCWLDARNVLHTDPWLCNPAVWHQCCCCMHLKLPAAAGKQACMHCSAGLCQPLARH